jgi:hypothetical protein
MTPDTIYTGLVTTKLSSAATALDSSEFKTNYEEFSQRCLRTLSDANVDVRANAIGFYTQWTILGVTKKLNDEFWYSIGIPDIMFGEFYLRQNKPESLLFVGGLNTAMSVLPLAPKEIFDGLKDTEISFMNDAGLFMFEKTLKNMHEQTSFGYSVYDRSEIVSEISEKFDMIAVNAWDVSYDPELIKALVGNLNTNGVLVISQTNNTSGIYNSFYKWNPWYGLHGVLLEEQGASYHLPLFYGTTIFVKN